MGDLALFVDSYDGNQDLWSNMFNIMNRYWPDCCFPKYLVTNIITFSDYGVQSIQVGEDRDWLRCTLEGLKRIEEKYIFFMFEDYYFSKKVNNNDLFEIVERMDREDIFFYRLSKINNMDLSKTAVKISAEFPYAINLQPAIWKREKLIEYLYEMQKKGVSTPWQFEFYFIDAHKRNSIPAEHGYVNGVLYDTRDLMGYKNAIIQGKWVRKVVNYYKRQKDIKLELGNRELMPLSAETWDAVKQLGHRYIRYDNREKLKRLLKRFHIKFMR